jgi:acetyl esterase/lipase
LAFDDLPVRPRANFPAAIAYAEEVLARSRAASERGDLRFVPDISYGPDPYQTIDLYIPREARLRLPVLLFLHGGAWTGGYKEWMGFMAPAIAATPAIFVSVSYRLAPEAPYPAAVNDTAAALAWVHRHIAEHGGDPDRIFIGGHSAGGHLAALVSFDPTWTAAQDLPPQLVKGVLPISASFELRFDETDPKNASHIAIRDRFMPAGTDIAAAGPITHAGSGSPPCLIAAGGSDFQILIDDALMLGRALSAANIPNHVGIVSGQDHFDASARCADPGAFWIEAARTFLRTGHPGINDNPLAVL